MGVVQDHSTEIDGVPYTCTTFTATEGLEILPRLINLFGERVIQLTMMSGPEKIGGLMGNSEVLAAIIAEASRSGADAEGGWTVLKDLLIKTRSTAVRIGENEVEGSVHQHFDSHFSGRLMHLVQVAVWVATKSF
jgi:hypothetical protein